MILLQISLLIMLVPAYLLARIFVTTELLKTIAVSIGFAVVISILSGFLLNFIEISTLSVWIFYLLLTIMLSLVVCFRKIELFPKIEISRNKLIILLAALLLSSAVIYYPRADYPYPNQVDEWTHLSYADKIISTGHLFNSPYGNYAEYNLESGTHILIAEVFLLTNEDMITNYKFLPVIFIIFTAFVLFTSVYAITRKFWLSMLPILFLLSLKSNANILGTWLFTPFSMSFPLVFLFLFLFSEGISNEKNNYLLSSLAILIITILFHASTAIMMGAVGAVFLILNPNYLKKHYTWLSASLIALILTGLIFSKLMWNTGVAETIVKILGYQFPMGVSYTYNYLTVYGIIPSLLAVLGLWIAASSRKLRIYAIFWAVMFIYYLVSHLLPYTIYIEYARIFYLLMLSSVVLSAIGFYSLATSLKQKYLKIFIVAVILILLAMFQFSHYYSPNLSDPKDIRAKWHRYIDENDYAALLWLKDSQTKDKKIFTTPEIGNVIPWTGNYPSARVRLVHGMAEETKDSLFFFSNSTCMQKRDILNKYNPDYVFSKKTIGCDFLKLEYQNTDYLYSINIPAQAR